MHVLYICHEYPPSVAGGIGTAVATLARGMVKAGHSASVLGFYPEPSAEDDQGVRVYRDVCPKAPRFVGAWYIRRHLRRLIAGIHEREPIDVVEWPDYQGWYLWPVPGVVDVLKVHGTHMSHRRQGLVPRSRSVEFMEMRMLRKIPNWIGVSDFFREEWREVSRARPRRETVVYNPVNTDLFVPPSEPREPGLVLYAGGFRRRKGVHVLAQAARLFLPRVPGARLRMLGYPSDITKEQILEWAGAADRIEFVPFSNQVDVARHMARASVYLMPSLYESCGNTWIEAMACQTPVVGSILSCGPEIVEDGVTGLLANPAEVEDVANKVVRLLTDPALAVRLGENGPKRVRERFSLEVAVKRSEEYYGMCLADRARN